MRKDFLPFARPSIGAREIEAAVAALESDWLTMGPRVQQFELAFKHVVGCSEAIAVSSGTAALYLALLGSKIVSPHEVITTPFTFASTANVVLHAGAELVFVDVKEGDLNIDPVAVRERLTHQTRAIIAVHFAGHPCDLNALRLICRERDILLVEDATHALGTSYQGERVGTSSDFAAFSFYPTKNMTAAEGGMAVTNGRVRPSVLRELSWYGLSNDPWARRGTEVFNAGVVMQPGLKFNMTDIQAAIGLVQLERLQDFNSTRARYANLYRTLLQGVEEIIMPVQPVPPDKSCWHLFVIRLCLDRLRIGRQEFCRRMAERNIGTSYHYRSLHLHPYYRERFGFVASDFPVAAAASESVVSLPLYPGMTERDVHDVAEAVKAVIAGGVRG